MIRIPPRLLLLCVLVLPLGCRGQPEPASAVIPPTPQVETGSEAQQRIASDMRTLADDAMAGRLVGTPGYDQAAEHVAARMAEAGLQPAGENGGWFQAVPLLRSTRLREGAAMSVRHADRDVALRFEDQFLPMPGFDAEQAQAEAKAVFVRQAVHAPAQGIDDFAGLDVRGKVAVVFPGAPEALGDANRIAHYSALASKLAALADRGAIAAVIVNSGGDEAGMPWAQSAANWQRPAMRLRDAQGKAIDALPQLQVVARVSATAADLVFDGSGHTATQVHQAMLAGAPGFELPVRIALAARSHVEPLESRNVLGMLPGGDASLAAQAVVYTAHLDHLGKGVPVDGDAIYNGAMDNALGVAIMLEAAREAVANGAAGRSLLFAALTAEEHGLLGAHWLVRNPPGGLQPVANLNIDMPLLLAPSKDVVLIGIEHSSLREAAEAAARTLEVDMSPDPFPEETAFVRSDQYAFVRAGIPALYLDAGIVSADGKRMPELAQRNFMRQHYHRPSDDISLPVYWPDAERMARLAVLIGRSVGDAPQPPRWNAGDFFGEH